MGKYARRVEISFSGALVANIPLCNITARLILVVGLEIDRHSEHNAYVFVI